MDYRKLSIFLGFVIIVLLILLFSITLKSRSQEDSSGLLSSRINSGLLESGNLLIFNFKPLELDIQEYIEEEDINVSLYVMNMRDGASFGINENMRFSAISLNKLPVAIITLKRVESGELSLDSIININEDDKAMGSGPLYKTDIKSLNLRELLRYMLQESDNTAFNILAREIELEEGLELTEYLDYYQSDIDYNKGRNSLEITPKNTANIFQSLYLSTILKPENSELILRYLINTSYDINRHANLPDDVIVAQKYGSFYYGDEKNFHSCGILYIKESRIFYCIMTKDIERDKAEQTVGDIVNMIYTYVIKLKY